MSAWTTSLGAARAGEGRTTTAPAGTALLAGTRRPTTHPGATHSHLRRLRGVAVRGGRHGRARDLLPLCVCSRPVGTSVLPPPPRWSSWLLLTPCPLGRAWLPLCLSRRWYSPSLTKSNRPNQPPLFSQWPPRPPLRRQRPRRYVHLHPYHACACKQARTHALRAPHFRTRPLSPCPSLLRRLPPAPRSPACTSST